MGCPFRRGGNRIGKDGDQCNWKIVPKARDEPQFGPRHPRHNIFRRGPRDQGVSLPLQRMVDWGAETLGVAVVGSAGITQPVKAKSTTRMAP